MEDQLIDQLHKIKELIAKNLPDGKKSKIINEYHKILDIYSREDAQRFLLGYKLLDMMPEIEILSKILFRMNLQPIFPLIL